MLKKVLYLLFCFILLFITSLPSPPLAQGAPECSAQAYSIKQSEEKSTPVPADGNDKAIKIEIATGGIDGGNVSVLIKPPSINDPQRLFKEDRDELATFPVENGKVTIPLVVLRNGYFKTGPRDDQSDSNRKLEPGSYLIHVVRPGETDSSKAYCSPGIYVNPITGGDTDYCSVTLLTKDNDYTIPSTSISIKVTFTGSSNTGDGDTHRVILKSKYGHETGELWTPTTADLKRDEGWKIPHPITVAGAYNIEVRERALSDVLPPHYGNEGKSCEPPWPFLIETEANGGGYECSPESKGCDYKNVIENDPLSLPCDKNANDYSDKRGCLKIKTALGTVETGASEFVRWVLGFVLGISGGIVLIIIIITGYRLMTSQGDPEKVKNAREQLTAAIVGLLFIIFSLVILQFITADILQLPGFGQ